jgi:uroporphyrinogen-III decarboxylase
LSDVEKYIPDETPFPSLVGIIKNEAEWVYEVDGWGRTVRRREGAYFVETLDVAIPEGTDPDSVEFDDPLLDVRYFGNQSAEDFLSDLGRKRKHQYIFLKTGGPFLRTCYVRGEAQFLMDMVADEDVARALADKVTDHITRIGVEGLERSGLHENGIWIYDDMGSNKGPVFSPKAFERVLLPAYRRMIGRYKEAGARRVLLHSDGNILPILDMLIDAGIDGLNPLEARAGMEIGRIRMLHPQLILTGGMDNTDTLLNGPASRIEAEARSIIDLGRGGGIVIGSHSVSPEIPIEHFQAYRKTVERYGWYR